jgi:hypothetical protein
MVGGVQQGNITGGTFSGPVYLGGGRDRSGGDAG